MAFEYRLVSNNREGRPRSKRLRRLGVSAKGAAISAFSGSGGVVADSHSHSNKELLDSLVLDENGFLSTTSVNDEDEQISTPYLQKNIFDDLFEKVEISDGKFAIKAKYDLFSVGGLTVLGYHDIGVSDSGFNVDGIYFGDWTDYTEGFDTYAVSGKSGKILYDLIKQGGTGGGVDLSKLGVLTLACNGVNLGTYTPAESATINMPMPVRLSELTNDSGFVSRSDFGQLFMITDPSGINHGTGISYDLSGTMVLDMPSALSGVTAIDGGGGALYLGNPDNNSYIYINEDMKSAAYDAWSITQSGDASFQKVTASSFVGDLTGTATRATTADKADAATRLSNAFSLWGQDFYGNDISGDMTGVGSIYMSGNITLKGSGNFGNKINFGDGDYVYLHESEDDVLSIHANSGINLLDATTFSRTATIWGNVGIGKTPTAYELDVDGSTKATDFFATNSVQAENGVLAKTSGYGGLYIYGGTSYYLARLHAFGASPGWTQNERWLDINNDRTTHFYHSLYSDGDITALGSSTTSDMRLKVVVRDFTLDIRSMADAPLFIHNWRDSSHPGEYVGTSAQYWKEHLPEAVSTNHEGWLSLAYGNLGVAMCISLARIAESFEKRLSHIEKLFQFT